MQEAGGMEEAEGMDVRARLPLCAAGARLWPVAGRVLRRFCTVLPSCVMK